MANFGRSIFGDFDGDESKKNENVDVVVLLVSLKSSKNNSEIVLARNPSWERLIKVYLTKHANHLTDIDLFS